MRSPIPWIVLALAVGVMLFILFSPTRTETVSLAVANGHENKNESSNPSASSAERTYEIVTLLPKDAIPAVYNPTFYDVQTADTEYEDDDLVIGVNINGEARAYSIPFLSGHEIVNDTVGGRAIAVTW